jgi:hypothetical protein
MAELDSKEHGSSPLRGVACPVCGGIVEAETDLELVPLATEHCLLAHGYVIPVEHVLASARPAEEL